MKYIYTQLYDKYIYIYKRTGIQEGIYDFKHH